MEQDYSNVTLKGKTLTPTELYMTVSSLSAKCKYRQLKDEGNYHTLRIPLMIKAIDSEDPVPRKLTKLLTKEFMAFLKENIKDTELQACLTASNVKNFTEYITAGFRYLGLVETAELPIPTTLQKARKFWDKLTDKWTTYIEGKARRILDETRHMKNPYAEEHLSQPNARAMNRETINHLDELKLIMQ